MKYIVCYDIKNDKNRNRIAMICKNLGLRRLQYSVYYGVMEPVIRKELISKVKKHIDEEDNLHVVAVNSTFGIMRVKKGGTEIEKKDDDYFLRGGFVYI